MRRVTELGVKLVQCINLFFWWKVGWTHEQARDALKVFGAETLHPSQTRHLYAAFQNGRTTLVDLQHAQRPKTGRSPNIIEAVKGVVNAEPSLTVAAISTQTGLSTTSVHRILKKELHLSLHCAKLVPNVLTPMHIVEQFTHVRNMLTKVHAVPSFLKVVTIDDA